ncbi:hypothetical protein P7K49_003189 [Saguinus oedipus]|uniref:Uncharacterized protein n=1 Tax=Saguinus oedipus TaxID=9490 RepID=A0ABQ9WJG6_SAGOE|nr:hypothetical protein P7K49_003189 [Saguinus oedipus]
MTSPGLARHPGGGGGQACGPPGLRPPLSFGPAPLPAPEYEENATFVSCSHLALAARGGGAEAAAAARPRPPGIFERCSWWRVGWAPKPTTKKGGGWPGGRGRRKPAEDMGSGRPGLAKAPAPCGRAALTGRHAAAPRGWASKRPGSLQG